MLAIGIPIDRMLIDQLAGGDEVDCIADINGQMALFELKDKEFNLGNAYSFGAKIGVIGPDRPVIVTTEYVGGDARAHFAKAQEAQRRGQRSWEFSGESPDGASVTYIEGIENIKAGLMGLISSVNVHHARRALNQALPLATLPTTTVLEWLNDQFVARDPLMAVEPLMRRGRRAAKQIGDMDEVG
jgi:hypothetical protein